MADFELKVLPGKYSTVVMSQLAEQVLKWVNPDDDWSVQVVQTDKETLGISLMSVN